LADADIEARSLEVDPLRRTGGRGNAAYRADETERDYRFCDHPHCHLLGVPLLGRGSSASVAHHKRKHLAHVSVPVNASLLTSINTQRREVCHDTESSTESQPVDRVVKLINPILRGWVNYFAVGHSSECFSFIQDWVEKKVRRHMGRAQNRKGFGWKRWSRQWLYETLRVFNGYRVRRPMSKVALAG
jgi:hypothetical protein